jgi:hypothetical protein
MKQLVAVVVLVVLVSVAMGFGWVMGHGSSLRSRSRGGSGNVFADVQARKQLVSQAAQRSFPNATIRGTRTVGGFASSSNDCTLSTSLFVTAFDWENEPVAPGVAGAYTKLLEQAALLDGALAPAGFVPVEGDGAGLDPRSLLAHSVNSRVQVDRSTSHVWGGASGRSSGPYDLDANAPRVVHWRQYIHNGSGATISARIEYDLTAKTALSEVWFSDASVGDVDYPAAAGSVQEAVEGK